MLGSGLNYPDFPALKFEKESKLVWPGKPHGRKDKKVSLYRLDWKAFDERMKKKHEKWKKSCWPHNQEVKWVRPLPENYLYKLDNMLFAVSPSYMREIVRNAQRAVDEHGIGRSFDTSVREYCYRPAAAYVDVALYLLTDCAYDEETQYYLKGDRRWLHKAMLYRLWIHQTGHGVALGKAGSFEWSDREVMRGNKEPGRWRLEPEEPQLHALYQALGEHQEDLEAARPSVEASCKKTSIGKTTEPGT